MPVCRLWPTSISLALLTPFYTEGFLLQAPMTQPEDTVCLEHALPGYINTQGIYAAKSNPQPMAGGS